MAWANGRVFPAFETTRGLEIVQIERPQGVEAMVMHSKLPQHVRLYMTGEVTYTGMNVCMD